MMKQFLYLFLCLPLWSADNPLLPYAKSWANTCDASAAVVERAAIGRRAEEAVQRFASCVNDRNGPLISKLERVAERLPEKRGQVVKLMISELLQSSAEFNAYDEDHRHPNETQLQEFRERYQRYKARTQLFLKLDPSDPTPTIAKLLPIAWAANCDEQADYAAHTRTELGAAYAFDALRNCVQNRHDPMDDYAYFLSQVAPASPLALQAAVIGADMWGDISFASNLSDTANKTAGGPTQLEGWRERVKARTALYASSPVGNADEAVGLMKSLLRVEFGYTCSDIFAVMKHARPRSDVAEFRLRAYVSCLDSRVYRFGAILSALDPVKPQLSGDVALWLGSLEKLLQTEEHALSLAQKMEMDGHNLSFHDIEVLSKQRTGLEARATQALENYFN